MSENTEITGTIQELAEKMGVEYAMANSVLKWLADKGVVKNAGVRPNPPGKKGKASCLYTIPTSDVSFCLLSKSYQKK